MKRIVVGLTLLAVGCGSQDEEGAMHLARLVAAEVPAARKAWEEAGQPNLLLRPGWPEKLFKPVADDPAVREVQVGVRYVDDRYVWTGFAASLYGERRVDYPQAQGTGPGRTTYRTYDSAVRGFDSYALLAPDAGPYSEPPEAEEPGTWSWERSDGLAVRVDAEDGTPVIVFYDERELDEETALPKGYGDKAKSAFSGAGLDPILAGLEAFRHVDLMLPSADLAERATWARDTQGLGHEELRAELAHLTKASPESLLAIRVSRIGVTEEFSVSRGRPVGIFLGTWQREGTEPLPRAGHLLGRARAGRWIVTALKGEGQRWVEATTWISWQDLPIRIDAYVKLGD